MIGAVRGSVRACVLLVIAAVLAQDAVIVPSVRVFLVLSVRRVLAVIVPSVRVLLRVRGERLRLGRADAQRLLDRPRLGLV